MAGGPTISPSGSDPLELTTTRTTRIGTGRVTVEQYSGPKTELEAKEAAMIAGAGLSGISELVLQHARGRGTLTCNYERIATDISPANEAVQELYGMDLVQDVLNAPYWKAHSLTNTDIAKIRYVVEHRLISGVDAKYAILTAGWGTYHWQLYGHMINGQDSYMNTMYEFRETYRVVGSRALKKASSNPNTVVSLPALGSTITNLIDSLPTGEWLKKPTNVISAGKGYWDVKTCYQLLAKWSVIYGGTFTGVDA